MIRSVSDRNVPHFSFKLRGIFQPSKDRVFLQDGNSPIPLPHFARSIDSPFQLGALIHASVVNDLLVCDPQSPRRTCIKHEFGAREPIKNLTNPSSPGEL